MNQTINIQGVVLYRKDVGETDRLISVFTRELGKIMVIARGSRKLKSKMAAHIEPFSVGKYQIVEGKTFYILTGAEKLLYFDSASSGLDTYREASYVCELVNMSFQEKIDSKNIYDALVETLTTLRDSTNGKRDIAVRYFELKLLTELGYKPDFTICKKCQKTIPEQEMYVGGFEGVVCPDCEHKEISISKNVLKLLRLMQRESLKKVLAINNIWEYNSELEKVIHPFLLDILPRPPKSLEL